MPRQEITGTDRQWAQRYEVGDVVRYSRGSKALGVEAGDYARVEYVDVKANQVPYQIGSLARSSIDTNGRMELRWDSGRTSSFDASERRHLDYAYALTSHSSQGQTSSRVLVHVETERASEKLVNQRFAYVAVSRGQYDARINTDDKVKLSRALDRDVSHRSALERTPEPASQATTVRSRGVNRAVTGWPSLVHDRTVLRGIKGPLRRLRRP